MNVSVYDWVGFEANSAIDTLCAHLNFKIASKTYIMQTQAYHLRAHSKGVYDIGKSFAGFGVWKTFCTSSMGRRFMHSKGHSITKSRYGICSNQISTKAVLF